MALAALQEARGEQGEHGKSLGAEKGEEADAKEEPTEVGGRGGFAVGRGEMTADGGTADGDEGERKEAENEAGDAGEDVGGGEGLEVAGIGGREGRHGGERVSKRGKGAVGCFVSQEKEEEGRGNER